MARTILREDQKASSWQGDGLRGHGQRYVHAITAVGAEAVIPPRQNRIELHNYDRELYKARVILQKVVIYNAEAADRY